MSSYLFDYSSYVFDTGANDQIIIVAALKHDKALNFTQKQELRVINDAYANAEPNAIVNCIMASKLVHFENSVGLFICYIVSSHITPPSVIKSCIAVLARRCREINASVNHVFIGNNVQNAMIPETLISLRFHESIPNFGEDVLFYSTVDAILEAADSQHLKTETCCRRIDNDDGSDADTDDVVSQPKRSSRVVSGKIPAHVESVKMCIEISGITLLIAAGLNILLYFSSFAVSL